MVEMMKEGRAAVVRDDVQLAAFLGAGWAEREDAAPDGAEGGEKREGGDRPKRGHLAAPPEKGGEA